MILSLEDTKLKVIIDSCFKEFSFDPDVREFHVYKDVWNPRIGEDCLKCRHGKGNKHDDFKIDVYRNNEMKEIVGHIPLTCLKQCLDFSSFPSQNFVVRSQESV